MAKVPYRFFLLLSAVALGLCVYLALNGEVLLTQLNQNSWHIESRLEHWDWQDTDDEIFCRNQDGGTYPRDDAKELIPNVVHFIFLAAEGEEVELSYAQFLAIKAAVLRVEAEEIKIHTYALKTSNLYWRQIRNHVSLIQLDRDALPGPHGLEMKSLQLAHQSDVIRMEILMREGGIYLDSDVYVLKPFTDLLDSPRDILMGHEGGNRYGLCNAVIVARPHGQFLEIWRESYGSFNPSGWNEHSVLLPKILSIQHPDLICPLSPSVFFWPTWTKAHARYMHEPITEAEKESLRSNMTMFGGVMYENQLSIHAWGMHDYLARLTEENVRERDTRFNVLLREVAGARLP